MHDFVIDRGANSAGESQVAKERGDGAFFGDDVAGDIIEILSRDSRSDRLFDGNVNLADDQSGPPHRIDFPGIFDRDCHCLLRRRHDRERRVDGLLDGLHRLIAIDLTDDASRAVVVE
jgi:hypothetical protein